MGERKFIRLSVALLSALIVCILLDAEAVQAQAEPTLVVIVERTPVGLNETVVVTLEARLGVQTAAGAEATLSFDPTILLADAVTAGSDFNLGLLDGGPEACEFDNTTGRIRYGAGKLGAAPTGTFTLCVIRFTSRQYGTSAIDFIEDPGNGRQTRIVSVGQNILASTAGADVTVDQTVAVTLGWFLAERHGKVVDFRWQTATETGSAGFNILTVSESGTETLNKTLIPSKVIDSVDPTDYHFSAETDLSRFILQEVGISGSTTDLGPFELGVPAGVRIDLGRPESDDGSRQIYLPLIR